MWTIVVVLLFSAVWLADGQCVDKTPLGVGDSNILLGTMSYSSFNALSGSGRLCDHYWQPNTTDTLKYIQVTFASTQQINSVRLEIKDINSLRAEKLVGTDTWENIETTPYGPIFGGPHEQEFDVDFIATVETTAFRLVIDSVSVPDNFVRFELLGCPQAADPVDCVWGDWGDWVSTECSVTCGDGTTDSSRSRVKVVIAENGGQDCEGNTEETKSDPCNPGDCGIVTGAPHIEILVGKDEYPVCFDLPGIPGQIYRLISHEDTGIVINGELDPSATGPTFEYTRIYIFGPGGHYIALTHDDVTVDGGTPSPWETRDFTEPVSAEMTASSFDAAIMDAITFSVKRNPNGRLEFFVSIYIPRHRVKHGKYLAQKMKKVRGLLGFLEKHIHKVRDQGDGTGKVKIKNHGVKVARHPDMNCWHIVIPEGIDGVLNNVEIKRSTIGNIQQYDF